MIEETQIPDVETSVYDDGGTVEAEVKLTLGDGLEVVVVNKHYKDELEVWIQEPDEDKPKEDWERICIGHSEDAMVGQRFVDGEPR